MKSIIKPSNNPTDIKLYSNYLLFLLCIIIFVNNFPYCENVESKFSACIQLIFWKWILLNYDEMNVGDSCSSEACTDFFNVQYVSFIIFWRKSFSWNLLPKRTGNSVIRFENFICWQIVSTAFYTFSK